MNNKFLLAMMLALPVTAGAQVLAPYTPTPTLSAPVVALSQAQLDQLTGTIALYPDPLVAPLLTAATYPLDVVSASQWLRAHPVATELEIQALPYDASIKTLIHYPTVLAQLADNVAWTQSLGNAFRFQSGAVIDSIQRLRGAALASGALMTTPQQQVIINGSVIQIVPVSPTVVYIPTYDPVVVYTRGVVPPRDAIRFNVGIAIGSWLNLDIDWAGHAVRHDVRWDTPRGPVIVAPRPPEHHDDPRPAPWPYHAGPGDQHDDHKGPDGHGGPNGHDQRDAWGRDHNRRGPNDHDRNDHDDHDGPRQ